MSGDQRVLRDELATAITAAIDADPTSDAIWASERSADAVLAHPRVAAALRVLEAVECVKPNRAQLMSSHDLLRWLRAVAVEQ